MSYVSIWKPVHDRIVQAARDTGTTEIIGLLIGRLQDDTIIIEDSTTGEFSSEPHRVTLPASSLARIADDIVTGRLKGNIVGWYHSHTAGGVFFSETDIATQTKLQQFSSLITGMVVDASNGEVGYFRVVPQTQKAVRISNENIVVYAEEHEALPRRPAALPIVAPTPTVEVRRRPPNQQQLLPYRQIIAIVLVALIVTIAIIGALVYVSTSRTTTPLTINHTPVLEATIGTPTTISANTTEPVRNVTLVYGSLSGPQFDVAMNSVTSSEFTYTIPGTEVTGTITYYIEAFDMQGNEAKTATYHISVGDFGLMLQSSSVTVYRTKSVLSQINLLTLNNFNQQLSLSSTGAPAGLTVAFASNPTSAGTIVNMNLTASSLASNGTYPIAITATYTPPQSPPVSRQATLQVTVADFNLQVTPTTIYLHPGGSTTLTVTLTLEKGFVDPITVTALSLPQGATYTLTSNNPTVLAGSPGTTSITLQITAPMNIKLGTYAVQVQAAGAGIVHIQAIQLTVR